MGTYYFLLCSGPHPDKQKYVVQAS